MFTLAIGLILGWKVAGYYGLDRYVLPLLGTPWHPGTIAGEQPQLGIVTDRLKPAPGGAGLAA